MKPSLIIFIFLTLTIIPESRGQVSITGKINGNFPSKIDYSVPINGICYYEIKDSARVDFLGNFDIKLAVSKPAFICLQVENLRTFLIVEPDQHYAVEIDSTQKSAKISGRNERGQNLYNTFPKPFIIQIEADPFMRDTSLNSVHEKISALKQNDMAKLKNLLDSNLISTKFYKLVSKDRDCYYSSLEASVPLLKYWESRREDLNSYTPEVQQWWGEIFEANPLSQIDLMSSPYWFEYAQNYLNFKEYTQKDFQISSIDEYDKKGLLHTHEISLSEMYLPRRLQENYQAQYIIFFSSLFQRFEKEFITIYDQFKRDYPLSKYLSHLDPWIKTIVNFNEIIEKDFAQDIHLIQDYSQVNSLKQAFDPYKGRKLYVAIWATWCGPCRSEFSFQNKLLDFLKTKSIPVLYVSIDENNSDQFWKDMIKYHDLKGFHIRANNNLLADLIKVFNDNHSIAIPWYMIIDEQGNIQKLHAHRPSELKELKSELGE